MRAWELTAFTGLSALRLVTDRPPPTARPGQVVGRVRHAALNPADRYLAEGAYPAKPPTPHVLGRDAVIEVTALGEGVSGLAVGDRRILLRCEVGMDTPGAFADLVAVPAAALAPIPAGWDELQAAGAALVTLTAWQALTQHGDLPAGGVLLVTGASGGVGVASVQLGKAMGLRVVAMSRGPAKSDALRQLGADVVLDPQDDAWPEQLKRDLGQKVDLAIDNIGGAGLSRVIDVLAMHGRVSCVGRLAGPVPQFNTASLFFRRIRMMGVSVGTYSHAQAQEAWASAVQLLQARGARPLVDQVFEFEQLPAAFARLAAGPLGKVLLRVGA